MDVAKELIGPLILVGIVIWVGPTVLYALRTAALNNKWTTRRAALRLAPLVGGTLTSYTVFDPGDALRVTGEYNGYPVQIALSPNTSEVTLRSSTDLGKLSVEYDARAKRDARTQLEQGDPWGTDDNRQRSLFLSSRVCLDGTKTDLRAAKTTWQGFPPQATSRVVEVLERYGSKLKDAQFRTGSPNRGDVAFTLHATVLKHGSNARRLRELLEIMVAIAPRPS